MLDREVDDPTAKRFFKVMARSDLATESHNTNGLNALKNFVMDVDGYIGLYSIQNGNEQLIECLQSEVDADIQLNHRVLKVGKTAAGRYQLNMMNGKGPETRDFDLVVMCLPHSWLATMGGTASSCASRWSSTSPISTGRRIICGSRSCSTRPFWGEKIPGAWFMSEAFGGCCVYNEGARHDVGKHGVLNWLIAGSDALAFANLGDQELIDAALKSLPASLGDARAHFMEGKIHRWLSSVNALARRHAGARRHDQSPARAEAASRPGRGRRLSCSIRRLTACSNSSDAATDIIVTEMMRLRRAREDAAAKRCRTRSIGIISRTTAGLVPIARSGAGSAIPPISCELIKIVWNRAAATSCWSRAPPAANWSGLARARDRCLGHREQPRHPRPDAESAAEVQQARLDRRHAVQGR